MIWDFVDILTRRLLVWSAISLITGFVFWCMGTPVWQGIGLQAVLWSVVDAGIAMLGRRGLSHRLEQPIEIVAAKREAGRFSKILRINTLLDVLYVLGGFLIVFVIGLQSPFAIGNGWGVVIQGGFLFLFDLFHLLAIPQELLVPDLHVFRDSKYEDFWMEGGNPAAIVVHGFPGTPDEMRSFAEALHTQGWSVRGLLLSGHGAAIGTLFQHRVSEWTDEIRTAVEDLKQNHAPVLLVGYSMGGGLSVLAVASGAQPDALILISPFWWYQPLWSRWMIGATRLVLPMSFAPLPRLNLNADMIKQALHGLLPDLDMDSPEMQSQIKGFRAPLVFLEQFRRMGVAVERKACQVSVKTCIIQGDRDPVVRPALTRKLAGLLNGEVRYKEVSGKHEINIPGNPGHRQALEAVIEFAEEVKTKNPSR
jgi:alpha-beta hydrolase superfamily lysophospholipase